MLLRRYAPRRIFHLGGYQKNYFALLL